MDDRRLMSKSATKLDWVVEVGQLAIGGIFTSVVTWFSLLDQANLSSEGGWRALFFGGDGWGSSLEQKVPIAIEVLVIGTQQRKIKRWQ
jgi:hypothetical protein